MANGPLPDYYELLQVSPRADRETIERVFRLLAKRYHPDNYETGNAEMFSQITDAFRILSDAEKRAAYDAQYESTREKNWNVFDKDSANNAIQADNLLRTALLSILYVARRNNPSEPGIGIVELERLVSCPEQIVKFQMWYLRENGWIQRLESGHFAITATGVDRLFELGGPINNNQRQLTRGDLRLEAGDTPSKS
jgi:curved DNA-binding protein CbpA